MGETDPEIEPATSDDDIPTNDVSKTTGDDSNIGANEDTSDVNIASTGTDDEVVESNTNNENAAFRDETRVDDNIGERDPFIEPATGDVKIFTDDEAKTGSDGTSTDGVKSDVDGDTTVVDNDLTIVDDDATDEDDSGTGDGVAATDKVDKLDVKSNIDDVRVATVGDNSTVTKDTGEKASSDDAATIGVDVNMGEMDPSIEPVIDNVAKIGSDDTLTSADFVKSDS
ncbi:hypothetical protein SNE40_017248 [Patella caerulea]|uniref:Uncharacterized protein n=1 Tax=Patella caerulea TaxID=87958 RepID=A0AAN8JA20_PATCE